MLEDYKQLYKECADNLLFEWKNKDRNDLCRYYVDNKQLLSEAEKNAYLSAIIYKFWNLIKFTYNKQEGSLIVLSYEDCYELLMESILYVLERAVWNNKDSSLYKDKKAPEKAISIRMKSISGNEKYLSLFTNKKKINNLSYSLDALQDNSSDGYYLKETYYTIDDIYINNIVDTFIINCIKNCDFFKAIVFDILYTDSSCVKDNDIDISKVLKICKKLDDSYLEYFIKAYHKYLDNSNIINIIFSIDTIKELKFKDIKCIINDIKLDIKKLYFD